MIKVLSIVLFVFITKAELPTVVIVHGLAGTPSIHSSYVSPLTKNLKSVGYPIYLATTKKNAPTIDQVKLLEEEINENINSKATLILIRHFFSL